MKQTAVQFLEEKLDIILELYASEWDKINEVIKQAKQMEKEQIIDAHYQGYRNFIDTTEISEQYYNETYGSKGNGIVNN